MLNCDAAAADAATITDTRVQATENLQAVSDKERAADRISDHFVGETVLDKGYQSRQTLLDLEDMNIRGYVSEPDRGRHDLGGQAEARCAVYAHGGRVTGDRGKRLPRSPLPESAIITPHMMRRHRPSDWIEFALTERSSDLRSRGRDRLTAGGRFKVVDRIQCVRWGSGLVQGAAQVPALQRATRFSEQLEMHARSTAGREQ